MDIIMLLCKSLNIIALSVITLIFILKLYGKIPDDSEKFNQYLQNNSVSSSVRYLACDKNLLTLSNGESTTCFSVHTETVVNDTDTKFEIHTKES